jgi:hypothetical protein
METSPQPPVLDYDRAARTRAASAVRFGGMASLLLLVNTLVGAAIVFALLFVDHLGITACLIAVAGVLLVFTVLGRLSVERPRFGQALALSALSCALAATSLALNDARAQQLEADIVGTKVGVVVVYVETDRGARLATLHLARDACVVATSASLALTCYVGFCVFRVARARRVAAARG